MRLILFFILVVVVGPVWAHAPGGAAGGFGHGFLHPFGGLDHMLALLIVGLLSFHVGGRALWFVPAIFLLSLTLGTGSALAGMTMPLVESVIILSLVGAGLLIRYSRYLSLTYLTVVAGASGFFHGQAHGLAIPSTVPAMHYGTGLVSASALLLCTAMLMGLTLRQVNAKNESQYIRATGNVISITAALLLSNFVS